MSIRGHRRVTQDLVLLRAIHRRIDCGYLGQLGSAHRLDILLVSRIAHSWIVVFHLYYLVDAIPLY